MITTLNQRFLFTTRKFEITDKSLRIQISTLSRKFENEYPFEEISRKIAKTKNINIVLLVFQSIALVFFIVGIMARLTGDKSVDSNSFIGFITVNAIIFIPLIISYKNNINLFLSNGTYIPFFAHSPSQDEVETFLEVFKKIQKEYLLNRYAKRDLMQSNEKMFEQIIWLKDINVIDDQEFEELKNMFLPDNSVRNPIGFIFKNSIN